LENKKGQADFASSLPIPLTLDWGFSEVVNLVFLTGIKHLLQARFAELILLSHPFLDRLD
jgi:hypothetical protein